MRRKQATHVIPAVYIGTSCIFFWETHLVTNNSDTWFLKQATHVIPAVYIGASCIFFWETHLVTNNRACWALFPSLTQRTRRNWNQERSVHFGSALNTSGRCLITKAGKVLQIASANLQFLLFCEVQCFGARLYRVVVRVARAQVQQARWSSRPPGSGRLLN